MALAASNGAESGSLPQLRSVRCTSQPGSTCCASIRWRDFGCMGIKGLQTLLEKSGVAVRLNLLAPEWRSHAGSREICVDGCGLMRLMFRPSHDWIRGTTGSRN